jgi:hypothetical protein
MNDFIVFATSRERSVESTVAVGVKTNSVPPTVSRVVVKPRLAVSVGSGSVFFFALSNGALTAVGVDSFGNTGALNKTGLVLKNDLYSNKSERDFSL